MWRQGGGAASCKQDCVWKNCACVLCTGDHLLSVPIFLVFCNWKLCFGMENFQIIHAAFEHGFPYRGRQFCSLEIIVFAEKPCSPSSPSTREAHGSIGFAIDTSSWVKFHKTRIFYRGEKGQRGETAFSKIISFWRTFSIFWDNFFWRLWSFTEAFSAQCPRREEPWWKRWSRSWLKAEQRFPNGCSQVSPTGQNWEPGQAIPNNWKRISGSLDIDSVVH